VTFSGKWCGGAVLGKESEDGDAVKEEDGGEWEREEGLTVGLMARSEWKKMARWRQNFGGDVRDGGGDVNQEHVELEASCLFSWPESTKGRMADKSLALVWRGGVHGGGGERIFSARLRR
jgi:hypothetical protein